MFKLDIRKIGEFLGNMRISRKMTSLQLANSLNINEQMVLEWEKGNSLPALEVLDQVVKIFGLSLDDIYRIGKVEETIRVIMLLDKSLSMRKFSSELIKSFNLFLERQKTIKDKSILNVVFFSEHTEHYIDTSVINNINYLNEDDFVPDGLTALYDAIGNTINKYSHTQEDHERVLMVIHTDGFDVASRKYTQENIAMIIKDLKLNKNWEFIFLGANFNVNKCGESLSIDKHRILQFKNFEKNSLIKNFEAISESVISFRTNGKIHDDWYSNLNVI